MSEKTSLSGDAAPLHSQVEVAQDSLQALQIKYNGLLARESRYKHSIAQLSAQQARDRKVIEQLRQRVAESTAELAAVQGSWRYRVGTWLLAPASAARQLMHMRRHAAARAAPVPSRVPAAAQVSKKSNEDLERLARSEPTADNAFAFAKGAYFQKGHIEQAYEAIAPFPRAQLTAGQKHLADVIGGLHRLMRDGPNVSPRQPNANLVCDPKRVMYCVHSAMPYLTNGYSTRTHGVAAGARSAGVEMAVAARPGFPWDTKGATDVPATGGRLGETLHKVPYVFTPGLNLETMPLDQYIGAAADVFAREALRQRAGLIHAASNHITGLAALMAARRLGLPFVYEVRGLWEVTQASDRPGWDSSDRYALAVRLESFVAQQADRVLAITAELRDELVRRGVPAERIELLPNCVDIEEFAPVERDPALVAELGLDPASPTIGFAGSVVAYEGLDLLATALGQLRRGGVAFNLLIVGDGSALASLKKSVETAGIQDCTRFTGRVPRDRVQGLLSCMDIMPCPRKASAVTEMVSPLKPLEAMAMAKAVLLSDVAPHLEFAGTDRDRAMLFRKDDVQDLARCLRELIEQPALRASLGRAARLWVAQKRTWTVAGDTLQGAYAAARDEAVRQASLAEAATPAFNLSSMRLALIADRFTTDSLGPDIEIVRPTPDNWPELLAASPVDALLVESAWEGNGGSWARRVGYYSDEEIATLRALVEYCRERAIPTIFWNKEDPVHFNRFERTAALFDHVLTTDSDCVKRYLATPNTKARTASALPFFAQPRIHNPLPSTRSWSHDICYAGSYYGERYAERSRRLDALLAPAAQLGLTIYDRQHFQSNSPYHFPDRLSPFVKGGLDYAEMVQAYKSHAVHLNVNSVEDSPTMFSRRVMEIAASGTALLSSAGRGVEETMAGTITTVVDEAHAEGWLRAWLQDESARHAAILPPLREVLRAHTAGHRLVQALRTGGLRVRAPELARYALVCDHLDDAAWAAIWRQTFPPVLVLAGTVDPQVPADHRVVLLQDAKIDALVASHGCSWIGLLTPEHAVQDDEHFYEDLLLSAAWSDRDGMGIQWVDRERAAGQHVPLVVADVDVLASEGLIRIERLMTSLGDRPDLLQALRGLSVNGVCMNRFRPLRLPNAVTTRPSSTILVAGHDLKFLRDIMDHWQRAGHTVLVDAWAGHSQHDPVRSAELIEQADVIFCEWCLGNAAWYSRNKRPHQRLVVRFHSQELRSPLVANVDATAVDRFVFVGAHIRDQAIGRFGFDEALCDVVPNYVSDAMFASGRPGPLPKTLALVGITPQMKRLDLALDLIRRLREADDDFRLIVKGRRPEEYPWMRSRPQEMRYYDEQYERIRGDQLLADGVVFEPHGDDMAAFYRQIGYAISVSDFESFHLTLADGAAAQAIPVSLAWEGADRIYPPRWLYADVASMAAGILQLSAQPWIDSQAALQRNAAYCRERFSVAAVAAALDRYCFQPRMQAR